MAMAGRTRRFFTLKVEAGKCLGDHFGVSQDARTQQAAQLSLRKPEYIPREKANFEHSGQRL